MARILVVEDNDRVRWTLAALLQSSGYDVAQAENGQQALTRFADHPTDMVLMDLHMPVMDGLEACQRLRQASQVPILMISTLDNPTIQEQVLQCGANGFICKPLEFGALMGWVREASEGSAGTDSPTRGPAGPPAGPSKGPGTGPGPASYPPDRKSDRPDLRRGAFSRGGFWHIRAWRREIASPFLGAPCAASQTV